MSCTVLGSTLLATAATLPSLGSGASVTVVTSARPPLVRPDVVGSLVLSITRAPSAPPIRPTTRVIAQSTGQNQPGSTLASRARSEERRVGKECDSTGRSRWSQYH